MPSAFASMGQGFNRRWVIAATVGIVLAVMYGQLALTARWDSMSVDEGNHTYTGYMSLTRGDFGLNPEHPPLVKLLAALPLLGMGLHAPEPLDIPYKGAAYVGGRELLSGPGKEKILFRANGRRLSRCASGWVVLRRSTRDVWAWRGLPGFGSRRLRPKPAGHWHSGDHRHGRRLFSSGNRLFLLPLRKGPSTGRLLLVGLGAGFALAAKHNGIFLFQFSSCWAFPNVFAWPTETGWPGPLCGSGPRKCWRLWQSFAFFRSPFCGHSMASAIALGPRARQSNPRCQCSPPIEPKTKQASSPPWPVGNCSGVLSLRRCRRALGRRGLP